ncbi:MAG: clan AA aspartic protease [Syntrophaceae bacterium]|nr:clan AA aspartic protease [Syntrophaceae bacterium]
MDKKKITVDLKKLKLWAAVLIILMIPLIINAGNFYKCLDKYGNESLVDFPVDGQACMPVSTYEEKPVQQRERQRVVSEDDRITKVVVKGNQILVPVKIIHGREEANVNLLMDTGASGTAIHIQVADQLYINLYKARKTQAGIVGGGVIEASIIKVDSLQIGPHIIENCNVAFIPHEGRAVNFDGLLGMDILGKFGYRIDLANQIIIWQ